MSPSRTSTPRPVVVLSEFEGFHVGHQQLVHLALQLARRELRPLVAVVLDRGPSTGCLMTLGERSVAALARGCDAAHTMAMPVDGTRAGVQLVDEIVSRLHPEVVTLARLPGGDPPRHPALRAELRQRSIRVEEIERWFDIDGVAVTSDRIRHAIGRGEVARAHTWLGAPYTLAGEVVHGSGLGRTIGFPTANVDPPSDRLMPARGVYSATVLLPDGREFAAAVNIGVRPTVERRGALLIEAHLLDFDEDIYGQRIQVGMRHWLRDEVAYGSVDALVAQLTLDAARARISLGR